MQFNKNNIIEFRNFLSFLDLNEEVKMEEEIKEGDCVKFKKDDMTEMVVGNIIIVPGQPKTVMCYWKVEGDFKEKQLPVSVLKKCDS